MAGGMSWERAGFMEWLLNMLLIWLQEDWLWRDVRWLRIRRNIITNTLFQLSYVLSRKITGLLVVPKAIILTKMLMLYLLLYFI